MITANIHEAKTNLSSLLQHVLAGEEVIIQKAGKPIARLMPYEAPKPEPKKPRVPGAWKGQVWMADDFDELPEDVAAAFRGELP